MKKTAQFLATALIIFTLGCSQNESITEAEVVAVLDKFDTAWKEKQAKTVDSVLGPRYIYFTQSAGIFDRTNVVNTAGSADYKLEKTGRQVISIQITGNTAVVNTIWTGKGSYYGKPFDDRQRCSVTVIKQKGKVIILSEHCTVLPR